MSLEPEVMTRRALREQESRHRAAHRAPLSSARHSAAPVAAAEPFVAAQAGLLIDAAVPAAAVMPEAQIMPPGARVMPEAPIALVAQAVPAAVAPPVEQPMPAASSAATVIADAPAETPAAPKMSAQAKTPAPASRRHSAHRHPNGARRPPLKADVTDVVLAAAVRRSARRRVAFTAVASSIGLAASLIIAGPAQASPFRQHSLASVVTPAGTQTMRVSGSATRTRVIMDDYSANKILGIVAAAATGGHDAANAVALALNAGGERATIVRTALDYFGDPYVLGGASHSGIDCSGLTMLAYAAVGITLAHYVPTQDALGVTITEAEAQPGDFVVFNDEEHIGIYLGNGMVLHAPATGRTVSIEAVSIWQSVGIHFTRILPN